MPMSGPWVRDSTFKGCSAGMARIFRSRSPTATAASWTRRRTCTHYSRSRQSLPNGGPQHRSIDFMQRRTLMHRDVIGLVALDLVLRIVGARVMGVTLVLDVFRVHPGDFPAHVPCL